MLPRLLGSLLAAALLTVLPTTPAVADTPDTYTPKTGVKFNYPIGSEVQKRRLFRHIVRSVNSSPPGSTIRFAVYSFADKTTADALVNAHRRGVRVKLIFSGKNVYPPMQRLQAELGRDPSARSFAIWCDQSCRGEAGQMHAKFFQFSRAGKARNITMVGSINLTEHNSHEQWSDLYTVVAGGTYYQTFRRWFTELKPDRPVPSPYLMRADEVHRIVLSPIDLEVDPDPVVRALDKVTCLTRAGDLDPAAEDPEAEVATSLLISAHAWNGPRGKRLAHQVADLVRAGCTVRVFYGEGTGPAVRNIVGSPGAELRKGTHKGIRTHQKLMIVNGHYGRALDTIHVLTGSHNWSTRALPRDDVIVEIDDQTVGRQYVTAFWRMWNKG